MTELFGSSDEQPIVARYIGDTEAIRRNPFLAALPPDLPEDIWTKQLERVHDEVASIEMTDAARDLRIGATEEMTVVLPHIVRLRKDVLALIRDGYYSRRLTGKSARLDAPAARQKYLEAVIDNRVPRRRLGQKALALIGMSGSGKTTALRAILESLPPVIEHQLERPGAPRVQQIVWLLLDAPAGKSMKGLCLAILDAFDEILYTDYADTLARNRASDLQQKVRNLTRDYSVGVLAIDESQVLGGQGVSENELIDYLVTLTNVVGVPLILVGTPDAQSVLRAAPRLVRRTLHAKHRWNAQPNGAVWNLLVRGMLSGVRVGMPYSDSVDDAAGAFHPLVEGVPAFLAKMMVTAQRSALRAGRKTFAFSDCQIAASEFPEEVQEILEVIRKQRAGVHFTEEAARSKESKTRKTLRGNSRRETKRPTVRERIIPGFGDIRRLK